jgi:hypothetical protein
VALGDLFAGRLTFRRLGVLVRALPSDSSTVSAIAPALGDAPPPETPRQWSTSEAFLAAAHNQLSLLRYSFESANSGKGSKVPKPFLIEPPSGAPARVRMTLEQKQRIRDHNHNRRD